MKKIIFLTLLSTISSLFLSGFMNKKIQKTLSVSNKIDGSSLYLIDEDLYGIKIPISLNDKDFFGLSYKSHISSECFKHSIDETNFNNMLSNGVKVMAIIDYDWTKEVVFNSFVKRKNGYFEVNENKGSCVGKTYLIEGEEKIINNFSKKIKDSKSVSKTGSMKYITYDPTKEAPVITEDTYSLETQKNSKGQTINILTFEKWNELSFINLDGEGYYSWISLDGESYKNTNRLNNLLNVVELSDIKKIKNKYELHFYDKRTDKNNNTYQVKSIMTYDNLKE